MEIYHNFKVAKTKQAKSVCRTVAINYMWKSILTENGLEIRPLMGTAFGKERLKAPDLSYKNFVESVDDALNMDRKEIIEDKSEYFVDLKDILEKSKEYINEKTYNRIIGDVDNVLILLDEALDWVR